MQAPLSKASPSWVSFRETVVSIPVVSTSLIEVMYSSAARSAPAGSSTPSPRTSRIPPIPRALRSLMTPIASARSSPATKRRTTPRVSLPSVTKRSRRGFSEAQSHAFPSGSKRLLLEDISPHVTSEQTVLSFVAAIPTTFIEERLGATVPVVRAMPNTASVVHEGMAGIAAGRHAGEEHLSLSKEVLAHVGRVVIVQESYLDAVTAISGSGPAYFALLAEAMIEAGILLGLSREVSTDLVVQTMFGSAKLLRDEHMHPVELREMVTSPGGTTIRAIRVLEQSGVRAAFLNAIQAAMERSVELAKGEPQA